MGYVGQRARGTEVAFRVEVSVWAFITGLLRVKPTVDRMLTLAASLAGQESIREVIAFPKTQKGTCPLTDAPAPVDARQLRDLGIRVVEGAGPA